jgi:hypothetical protein
MNELGSISTQSHGAAESSRKVEKKKQVITLHIGG